MADLPVNSTLFLMALAGACWGSFLNQWVDRSPRKHDPVIVTIAGKPISWCYPIQSHCLACQKKLSWLDNLPLFSWLYLGGRCRYCRVFFGIRTLLMEASFTLSWPLFLLIGHPLYWLVPTSVAGLFVPLLLEKRSISHLWHLWLILLSLELLLIAIPLALPLVRLMADRLLIDKFPLYLIP